MTVYLVVKKHKISYSGLYEAEFLIRVVMLSLRCSRDLYKRQGAVAGGRGSGHSPKF